jgi:hypothetical protein
MFVPSQSICNHVRAVYAESHDVEQQGNCLGVERRPPFVNLEQNDGEGTVTRLHAQG